MERTHVRCYGLIHMQAERTFTLADLAAFAELSGDYNPLHTDPVVARRTQLGECVAHGIFVLMWALDCAQRELGAGRQWAKVSAKFLRPIRAGAVVRLALGVPALAGSPGGAQRSSDRLKPELQAECFLTVTESGRVLCQIEVGWSETGNATVGTQATNGIPPREKPAQLQLENAMKTSGALDLFWSSKRGAVLFPALAATQKPDSLAALLATTRVIGMKVPGEQSVFIQLAFAFAPYAEVKELFTYRVAEYRKSSQRLGIAIAGAAGHGLLWALVRPAPVVQPGMAAIKQRVAPDRFAGRKVIVIGGSRGLGEIAAKALAAGGAEVVLTYRLGSDDANRVVADITANGGKASALQLDTAVAGWEASLSSSCTGFDHLCYFATPPIVEGDGSSLNVPMFEKFSAVYVAGLVSVAQWLVKNTAGKFAFFNASTVAVDAPPLRNLEYAAAKAAGEACCRWLAAANPKARVYAARFPRLNTDQTASFLSAGDHDSLETVLRELSVWLPE